MTDGGRGLRGLEGEVVGTEDDASAEVSTEHGDEGRDGDEEAVDDALCSGQFGAGLSQAQDEAQEDEGGEDEHDLFVGLDLFVVGQLFFAGEAAQHGGYGGEEGEGVNDDFDAGDVA